MKRFITSACLLLAGVAIGWWLRDLALESKQFQPEVSISSPHTQTGTSFPNSIQGTTANDASPMSDSPTTPSVTRFGQLLAQREYKQALAYYENALKIDDGYQGLLKPRLEEYLGANLQHCTDGDFVDLVDQWLNAYYQDIPVLLLLAEYQRICNSPEEAASTLQLASTYAMQPGQQERVLTAVARLVAATDKSLSQQQRRVELLGFYEYLKTIDLATNTSELRRAALYQQMGEFQRSRALLSVLRGSDDGLDPQWTAALDHQWSNSVPEASPDDPPMQAIPLTRRGDHYLVTLSINDGNQVNLIVDTGASVTVLSRDSFARINSAGLGYRGSRLFNTANGMTQGDMYQAASITLGNARLSAPEIAVLDYQPADGVDGLLGMNVLRNFHFEIDQDRGVLHLGTRR